MTQLSKSSEFRQFWLYQSARDHVTENFKDVEKWKREFVADDLTYHPEIVHVVEITALQQANAKIQELQDDLAKEQKQTDEIVGNMVNERAEMNRKITELEQQLKDEKCFNDAGSKELNEACSRVKELEQQLKKAESVIEFYGDVNNWNCSYSVVFTDINTDSEWLKRTDEYGNHNVDWEVGGKRARQYLKSRGE